MSNDSQPCSDCGYDVVLGSLYCFAAREKQHHGSYGTEYERAVDRARVSAGGQLVWSSKQLEAGALSLSVLLSREEHYRQVRVERVYAPERGKLRLDVAELTGDDAGRLQRVVVSIADAIQALENGSEFVHGTPIE